MDLRVFLIVLSLSLVSAVLKSNGSLIRIQKMPHISNDFMPKTHPFKKFSTGYFYIETNKTLKMNWFAALHKCREVGGDLLNIQSEQEWNEIVMQLNKHAKHRKCFWLSLTDIGEQGNFKSMTTGLPQSYLKWGKTEPNNMNNAERCVHLVAYNRKDFYMNDISCSRYCNYICEAKQPSQTNIVVG